MRLLIINPNTSRGITDIIAERVRMVKADESLITAVTAPFGASYISTPEHGAEAECAVVELLDAYRGAFDAAVICSSSDSGLAQARRHQANPVTAMTESALLASCMLGGPTAMIVYNEGAVDGMHKRAESYGLGHQLARVRIAGEVVNGIPTDEVAYRAQVIKAGRRARNEDGALSVIMGGSAASRMTHGLSAAMGIPVLEGISCAVKMAEALVAIGARNPQAE